MPKEVFHLEKGLMLLDQLNKSVTTRWEDFFEVFQIGHFSAAVSYTPDGYLKNKSKSDYIKYQQTNVVSRYYLDDYSLSSIAKELDDININLIAIDWKPSAKEKIDTIDLDEVNDIETLNQSICIIRDNLFPEEQSIMKLTFMDYNQNQYTLSSFGRVGIPQKPDELTNSFLRILL